MFHHHHHHSASTVISTFTPSFLQDTHVNAGFSAHLTITALYTKTCEINQLPYTDITIIFEPEIGHTINIASNSLYSCVYQSDISKKYSKVQSSAFSITDIKYSTSSSTIYITIIHIPNSRHGRYGSSTCIRYTIWFTV